MFYSIVANRRQPDLYTGRIYREGEEKRMVCGFWDSVCRGVRSARARLCLPFALALGNICALPCQSYHFVVYQVSSYFASPNGFFCGNIVNTGGGFAVRKSYIAYVPPRSYTKQPPYMHRSQFSPLTPSATHHSLLQYENIVSVTDPSTGRPTDRPTDALVNRARSTD